MSFFSTDFLLISTNSKYVKTSPVTITKKIATAEIIKVSKLILFTHQSAQFKVEPKGENRWHPNSCKDCL